MDDGITALLEMARWLTPAFPDQKATDVERTMLEIAYAGVLTLAYYLEDEKSPDVTWDDPALDIVYPASWNWRKDCLDFNAVDTTDSWITDEGQLLQVLSLITSEAVGKPGGFIAWSMKGGALSSLLPLHVIEELESQPQKRQQCLDALYKPYKLGRGQGLVFSMGIVELNVYPLFVDYDADEAFFPVHLRLGSISTKDNKPDAKQKEFVREILFPLKDAIIDRGGFADDQPTGIVLNSHLKMFFYNEKDLHSFMQSMIAVASNHGQMLQLSFDNEQQIAKTIQEVPRRLPPANKPKSILTDGQQAVWDALQGKALTGKELARVESLDTSEETVRQHIASVRRAGYEVAHRKGRGYYRPDAPPPT